MERTGGNIIVERACRKHAYMAIERERGEREIFNIMYKIIGIITNRPFSLSSLSPMTLESFLNSRLERALSVSTMRFWRCQRRQLRFSRR